MAVNKVVFGAVAIMDISDSTVTEDTLAKGVTAYDAKGEKITGTMEASADPVLQSKTVTPSTSAQTVTADSGYDGLSSVKVNAMPTATQATPAITVSSSGLITAKATQSAGYVSAGTKSATKQLTTQSAQTITPGTTDKTIAAGRYLTGVQTIKGDKNLIPENIVSGVSIFGVEGIAEAGGGGGSGEDGETITIVNNTDETIIFNGYFVRTGETEIPYQADALFYLVFMFSMATANGFYIDEYGEGWKIDLYSDHTEVADGRFSLVEANAMPGTVITFEYM